MSAARVAGYYAMRTVAATTLVLGVLLFPDQGRAGIAAGGVVALETSGDGGLWLGPTVSWWSEGFLGLDVDLRFGKDRGDSMIQVIPWVIAFKRGESVSLYGGVAPAIVDMDGTLSLQTDSFYLKGGARWHFEKYDVFAQATTLVGDLAPEGLPLGLEVGCEFRFGGRGDMPPEKKRIPRKSR